MLVGVEWASHVGVMQRLGFQSRRTSVHNGDRGGALNYHTGSHNHHVHTPVLYCGVC